ncbi:unnamed protein product [Mucor hiemalis]
MKFSYSAIISIVLVASSVMAAPAAEVDAANASPSIAVTTTTRDPMPGATAIASITLTGENDTAAVKAQKLSTSGSERTVIGAASVALPIAVLSAIALM